MKSRKTRAAGCTIRDHKQRGEWAELCFMARAAGEGLKVSRPWGDSSSYDVGVEYGGRFMRVQVKSTIYLRGRRIYNLKVCGPNRKKYPKGSVDFFAMYIVPIDTWYIVPYEAIGRTHFSLHFTAGSKRELKYGRFREAWDLFKTGRKGHGAARRRPVPKSGIRIEAMAEDWDAAVNAHPYTKVVEELLATGF